MAKQDGGRDTPPDINSDLIRDLAALLTETNLSEIEIEKAGLRLRVVRHAAPQVFAQATPAAAVPASGGESAPGSAERADPAAHPGAVTSPMVGTAYHAPEPGAPPFVKVGDQVREGQTLLIVEAMKTMNPIPAPQAGTVREILVANAQPVEFGETLMVIE